MTLGYDFCASQNHKTSRVSQTMQRLKQRIARLKNTLNREVSQMKAEQQSHRKSRTRQLITLGGLLQKSGLVDAFLIESEDDLQSYENRDKAAKLLGFLYTCFEENTFDEENVERWRTVGERLLKS